MHILLIEDQEDKIQVINDFIYENFDKDQCDITEAKSLEEARRQILSSIFDLIIFDIFLPITSADDSYVSDVSVEIINEFSQSQNYQTETIAITQYDIKDITNINIFNEAGVTVVHYSNEDLKWKDCLQVKLNRIVDKLKYDFLIFCALNKERTAYLNTDATVGELKKLNGLNCQNIKIGNHNGLCIKPNKMGLVNMAITASKAIEFFQPKIVAMSGICAGVEGEAKLLDLIIGDPCWEYQTGKFKDNEFKQEPYQSPIDQSIRVELDQFCQSDTDLSEIKSGLFESDLNTSRMFLAPVSSGSAVVASAEKMAEIELQHRKMAALEMEMYSLYEAARQSLCKPLYFGVKAVVDLGDTLKNDSVHSPASIISARFVVNFLAKKIFN